MPAEFKRLDAARPEAGSLHRRQIAATDFAGKVADLLEIDDMHEPIPLIVCLVFVAGALYNSWRAWNWTEVPEALEGREHLIPIQMPAVLFFGSYPLMVAVWTIEGSPANGSSGAVIAGAWGAGLGVAAALLGVSTYYFGRPRWMIAPIARDIPRWSPARRRGNGISQ